MRGHKGASIAGFGKGYIRAVVVAAGLVLCAVATPAAAQSFDRFLSRLSRCELMPEFEAFWRGIAAKYGNSHDAKSARVKPAGQVRAKFGAIVARNERMLRRKGSTEEFGSVSLRGTTVSCDRST